MTCAACFLAGAWVAAGLTAMMFAMLWAARSEDDE